MNNKKTVLIVDDIQSDINIQKEFLKYSQVRILTAHDGVEALTIVKRICPDLIIMDLYMPNMDGLECLQFLKADTEFMYIPIIITAGGNEAEKECTLISLCDDYLLKPLHRLRYLNKISKYISGIEFIEKRKKCDIKACLLTRDISIVCALGNISLKGAYIISDCNILPNDVISLSFLLSDNTQIDCKCRIIWVNRSNTKLPNGFGAEFVFIPRKIKEALKKFIATEN